MDESLKARLIGAAVLVAVAVLLIPELLSGRKTAERSRQTPPRRGHAHVHDRTEWWERSGDPSGHRSPRHLHPRRWPRRNSPRLNHPSPRRPSRRRSRPRLASRRPSRRLHRPSRTSRRSRRHRSSGRDSWRLGRAGRRVRVRHGGPTTGHGSARAGYRAYVSPVTRSGKTLHRVRVGPKPGATTRTAWPSASRVADCRPQSSRTTEAALVKSPPRCPGTLAASA